MRGHSPEVLAAIEKALVEHFSYDHGTGEFFWRERVSQSKRIGDAAGCLHKRRGYVYLAVTIDGKTRGLLAHRVAWFFAHGTWPAGVIDHIDGNKANNRIGNLRDTNMFVNTQNIRRANVSNRSSGLLGAHFDKGSGRWASSIRIDGKNKSLGRFDTAAQAHQAYVEAKRRLHPGCTI
ncbi:MAG: hypothetical protein RJA63_2203 [Pseudomonadota bacterium]|jgi:hypothetical protein